MLRALIIIGLCAVGCRTRDPDAAGLLSDGAEEVVAAPGAAVSPAPGAYAISCHAQDPEITPDTFAFSVRGAVSPSDESQPLVVSVDRFAGKKRRAVAYELPGRGFVKPQGNLFVGFGNGALTADLAGDGVATHTGLLTLTDDPGIESLAVDCRVTAVSSP
jgi:hypothetical protein